MAFDIMTCGILICLEKPADAHGWQKVLTFRKSPRGWTPLENSVAPESALVSSVQAYYRVPMLQRTFYTCSQKSTQHGPAFEQGSESEHVQPARSDSDPNRLQTLCNKPHATMQSSTLNATTMTDHADVLDTNVATHDNLQDVDLSYDGVMIGSMRGGALHLFAAGRALGVVHSSMITSTIHKSMRRKDSGTCLLWLVMRCACKATERAVELAVSYSPQRATLNAVELCDSHTANKYSSQTRAMFTQVVNRFAISLLEEGALFLCSLSTARSVTRHLNALVTASMDLKQASSVRELRRAVAEFEVSLRNIMTLIYTVGRSRIISYLGMQARQEELDALELCRVPQSIECLQQWQDVMSQYKVDTKSGYCNFISRIDGMIDSTHKKAPRFLSSLARVGVRHHEFASMVYRAVVLCDAMAEQLLRPSDDEDSTRVASAAPLRASLPDGYATYEQLVDDFGIRDVHTGQGTYEDFLSKGSLVEGEPETMVLFGSTLKQWRERYVSHRRAHPPVRKRARDRDPSRATTRPSARADASSSSDTLPLSTTSAAHNPTTNATMDTTTDATKEQTNDEFDVSVFYASNEDARSAQGPVDAPRSHTEQSAKAKKLKSFSMGFQDKILAQKPTAAFKARVVMDVIVVDSQEVLTFGCTKVFYDARAYKKTKLHYGWMKSLHPDMVSDWVFHDAIHQIYFPPPPGCKPMPLINVELIDCTTFDDVRIRVVDWSAPNLPVFPLKIGSSLTANIDDMDTFRLVQCCITQRMLGIGDVSPRNVLVQKLDGAMEGAPPHRLWIIDMSDESTFDPTACQERRSFLQSIFTCRITETSRLAMMVGACIASSQSRSALRSLIDVVLSKVCEWSKQDTQAWKVLEKTRAWHLIFASLLS